MAFLSGWVLFAPAGCRLGYELLSAGTAQGGSTSAGGMAGEPGVDATGGSAVAGSRGTADGGAAGESAAGGAGDGGSSQPGSGGVQSQGGGGGSTGGTSGGGTAGDGAGGSSGEVSSGGATVGGAGGSGNAGGGGTSGGGGGAAGTAANAGTSAAGSGGVAPGCSLSGETYAVCTTGATRDAAATTCASMGMQLIRVDSSAENDWLANVATDSWIGASDVAVEGEWRWSDGTLFWVGGIDGSAQDGLYTAWHTLSPGTTPPSADCARIESDTSTWIHVFCGSLLPFVCEAT